MVPWCNGNIPACHVGEARSVLVGTAKIQLLNPDEEPDEPDEPED